jgi:hypothetical protein
MRSFIGTKAVLITPDPSLSGKLIDEAIANLISESRTYFGGNDGFLWQITFGSYTSPTGKDVFVVCTHFIDALPSNIPITR